MNNNDNDINTEQPHPYPHPFVPNREQIRSFKRTLPLSIFDFYITDDITDPDKYLELIQTLKSCDQQDTVFIYLNTNGGNLYTTVQILSAMASSHAKVITCLEGQVCSAGTFIFLKGDTKIVNPNCTFMIHNYSQATSGKGNEIVSQVQYQKDYFEKLAKDIYGNFLTIDEIAEVMKGDDMWMHSHEVVDRLTKYKHDFVYTGEDLELDVKVSTELAPRPPDQCKTASTKGKKKVSKKKVSKKKTS